MYKHFTETPPIHLTLSCGTSFYIPLPFLSHSRHLTSLLSQSRPPHPPIPIPSTNPTHFRTYASFLFSNTLQLPSCPRCTTNPTNPQYCAESFWDHWNGCYALGFLLQDTRFRNRLIDEAIWQMGEWDEMPEGFHEVVYGSSGRGSMHRTLVLNLAFNTWEGRELEGVGRGEFGDDLSRYLMDALRADGVERRGVREVLSGMPRGVYWEREGEDGEERDGDGGAKVEEDTDVEDDHTGVQDYTKVEDCTDGGDETESTVEDDVVTEAGTKIEADVEIKQESESEAETK